MIGNRSIEKPGGSVNKSHFLQWPSRFLLMLGTSKWSGIEFFSILIVSLSFQTSLSTCRLSLHVRLYRVLIAPARHPVPASLITTTISLHSSFTILQTKSIHYHPPSIYCHPSALTSTSTIFEASYLLHLPPTASCPLQRSQWQTTYQPSSRPWSPLSSLQQHNPQYQAKTSPQKSSPHHQ